MATRVVPDPKAFDILKEAIVRLKGELGRTKLIKLVYLSDYFSRRARGKPISNYRYRLADHGPFDHAFYPTLKALEDVGIKETYFKEWDGYRYSVPDKPTPPMALDKAELEIVGRVIETFGKRPLNQLQDVVYHTEPMVTAKDAKKAGEDLDMESCNHQIMEELSLDFSTYLDSREALRRGEGISLDELINAL